MSYLGQGLVGTRFVAFWMRVRPGRDALCRVLDSTSLPGRDEARPYRTRHLVVTRFAASYSTSLKAEMKLGPTHNKL